MGLGFNLDTAAKVASPAYLLASTLKGGGGSTSQESMLTPEQKAAMSKLSNFAQTGKYGDFTAGAAVPLGYGDYNATGIEKQGQSALLPIIALEGNQHTRQVAASTDKVATEVRKQHASFIGAISPDAQSRLLSADPKFIQTEGE